LAGGGLGNLIDRITNEGRVVDFVSLGLGPVRTGFFNVADVAVLAGAMLLLYCLVRHQEKSPGPPNHWMHPTRLSVALM
jgi:signal peptidase II